jgi:AhpD family alkylhydroperoxidase
MARLPYVDPASAPAAVRELLDRLPAKLNIFRLLAHAETAVRPLLALGTAILAQQELPARTRELAILRVARLAAAEYEWVQHEPIARAAGVSEAQLAALRRDEIDPASFDAVERLVLRAVTEIARDGGASAATLAAMQRHFSTRAIVELVLTVGFYTMLAQLMTTAAIDLDPPAGILGQR